MTKRVYSEKDRARVYVALQINDGNVKRTARETGVPEQTVRGWKKQWEEEGVPPEVQEAVESTAEDFVARAERVRDLALDELEKQIQSGAVKPRELILGVGVLTDKIDRARGLARSQPDAVRVELPSREQLRELARGIAQGAIEAVSQRDQEIVEADEAEYTEEQAPALPPG